MAARRVSTTSPDSPPPPRAFPRPSPGHWSDPRAGARGRASARQTPVALASRAASAVPSPAPARAPPAAPPAGGAGYAGGGDGYKPQGVPDGNPSLGQGGGAYVPPAQSW